MDRLPRQRLQQASGDHLAHWDCGHGGLRQREIARLVMGGRLVALAQEQRAEDVFGLFVVVEHALNMAPIFFVRDGVALKCRSGHTQPGKLRGQQWRRRARLLRRCSRVR